MLAFRKGSKVIVLDNGFAATFNGLYWKPNIGASADELDQSYYLVKTEEEAYMHLARARLYFKILKFLGISDYIDRCKA